MSGRVPMSARKTSRFIRALRRIIDRPSAVSGLFLSRVFAVPAHSHPFRVLADPLRDVRRRSHCALLRRCAARVPEALNFAKCRVSDGAHRDHELEQAHYVILRAEHSFTANGSVARVLARDGGTEYFPFPDHGHVPISRRQVASVFQQRRRHSAHADLRWIGVRMSRECRRRPLAACPEQKSEDR